MKLFRIILALYKPICLRYKVLNLNIQKRPLKRAASPIGQQVPLATKTADIGDTIEGGVIVIIGVGVVKTNTIALVEEPLCCNTSSESTVSRGGRGKESEGTAMRQRRTLAAAAAAAHAVFVC